ncbi:outer membrane lipid asymmetry maintenance protein MlaD [Vibrio parahaemolyticus]|uniref:outer membrane lipid asymmetry maintenance protein MlaD n=1 Tax=Vibrio parahaemolyticus TaxID=670 RepID=UPI0004713E32|nr:outer membrane lipid asymmetry maintenance protein MlaD [Vibrio parahaemolyticus]EGQ9274826.1 outer membrane lipid asymmetry maintenance protein MlaD [Vibrio parahaemolyticus]EGQ9710200.1 outer membrane lipid asymmetry maintenance protein MlaD [Vibrio parahaemolyticus]EGQ9797745.1 outer membrane lipid asymmetry maintenance protein MlaD [Vibrio parahaemolyticus]EGR1225800.1 outer membrane lipid asymmetry maintenance protein MlaD [Vibrio parahaemolyticus]EHH1026342.1 outer membrane lipid asym
MQQTRKTELWVGSFVLAGICAILVMIFQVADVKSIGSGDTYILKAEFDNIGSLKVRSPVKVGGVVIGRVSNITLNPDNLLPVVSLSINSQYNQFPETSSVQILTSGLIGEQYIGLVPGFVFDDEAMLVDGDTIEDTKSALVLEDLIGQVLYSVGGSDGSSKE